MAKAAVLDSVATPASRWRSLLILLALAVLVFTAALLTGSSRIGLHEALAALSGSGDEATRNVLLAVRLPRVLAAFGVGSLLALAGVLLQALFRNSLADPYVLGVSGGRSRRRAARHDRRCRCLRRPVGSGRRRPRGGRPGATSWPAAAARRGCCSRGWCWRAPAARW